MSFLGGASCSKRALSCNLVPLYQVFSIFNYTSIVVQSNRRKMVSPWWPQLFILDIHDWQNFVHSRVACARACTIIGLYVLKKSRDRKRLGYGDMSERSESREKKASRYQTWYSDHRLVQGSYREKTSKHGISVVLSRQSRIWWRYVYQHYSFEGNKLCSSQPSVQHFGLSIKNRP